MIFYILLTYGNRPAGSIRTHPAAKAQLAFIKGLVSPPPKSKVYLEFDYARRVEGLSSLPNLECVLTKVKDIDGVTVRIDDLSRLFRITELNAREQLLADLQKFGSKLLSLRHGKTLSEFSGNELRNLILHAEKSKLPAQQDRAGDTENARASSLISRKGSSVRTARQLQEIKDELMDSEGKSTLQMVAEQANARGLRTTKGNRWTAQNVGRQMALLERAEQEK